LSPLLLVKNYKLGEKKLTANYSYEQPWADRPSLDYAKVLLWSFHLQKCWRWGQKNSVPLSRALGTAASYPLSSWGAKTPVKQGPKMLGIVPMGEEDSR